eukprot:scaffold634_cov97-Cylindrotheca_fusiformis.AAC.1
MTEGRDDDGEIPTADAAAADESTPLWQRGGGGSHRREASIEDMMLQSFHFVEEAIHDIGVEITTFQPLDEEEIAAEAEELGVIDFTGLDTEEEKEEAIENFIYPEDPFLPNPNKLGVLPLAVIVFYNVSGGPFGAETAVRAGGNMFALLGFIIGPLVWSIQEALMTAELGTTFPEAGAGVAWVEEAFGQSAGWMCGYLGWMAGATDNAIYPVLFMDYLLQAVSKSFSDSVDLHPTLRITTLALASIGLGYINWRGLPLVGQMSVSIGLIAMSPFFILIVVGCFKLDATRWFELPNADNSDGGSVLSGVMWGPFLNNLFWNLNSFDAAGSFAGEMDNAGTMFPKAMFWSVILVASGYFFPLLIAIGASSAQRDDWNDGFLAVVTGDVVGPWLGVWTVAAAAVSNIALFQAELSADSFQLMGMADRGHLPKILSKRSRHGTPTYGIILGVVVIVLMDLANDFDQLIEMLNFNYAFSLLMEYAAFIKLRISQPDLVRPYKIPMNTLGCILFFSPSVILTILILALAENATYLMFAGVVAVGLLIFWGKQHSQHHLQQQEAEKEEEAGEAAK